MSATKNGKNKRAGSASQNNKSPRKAGEPIVKPHAEMRAKPMGEPIVKP